MNEVERQRTISDLSSFYKKLRNYQNRQHRRARAKFSEAQDRSLNALRLELQRERGRLGNIISEYGGEAVLPYLGINYEVFARSLSSLDMDHNDFTALDGAISLVNKAIGKLESTAVAIRPLDTVKDHQSSIEGGEFELIVQGTPDMLPTLVTNVTKELNSQGYEFSFNRTSGRPDYTNWDKTYFASYTISIGIEGQVGTISFQLISNDRTLLKSTQPENWNPSFQQFMDHLLAEFQRLGFTDFEKEKLAIMVGSLPKAFISHGKESTALNKLQQFLSALGIEPIIVETQPSLGKTVDDKVKYYLDQADFVVILATGDDSIEGKLHPRQNVIHEIGLAQNKHADRIVYLLEERAQFPSNINPKVWERFNQENIENVFMRISIELRAFGILRAMKP